ncbi:cytochrome P450 2C30-like [Branchiostoma floridae x Branchiostoma belcheri]
MPFMSADPREECCSTFFLLLLLVVLLVWQWTWQRRRRWPPGPPALPIVGHLPWLGQKSHRNLTEWGKRYGDIIAVRFGSEDVVVLNSYRAFKEAYMDLSAEFAGRASLPLANMFSDNGKGIIFAPYGDAWKQQRKFVSRAIRHAALNNETVINQETGTLVSSILRHQGKPANVQSDVALSIFNVTCSFVFGQCFDPDDVAFKEFVSSLNRISVNLGSLGLSNVFPFLRKVPFLGQADEGLEAEFRELRRFIADQVHQHRQTLDQNDLCSLVDVFLLEMQQRTESGEGAGSFTEGHLMQTVFDVIIAGVDTVLSAFMWLVFYAAKFPALQKAVQEELDGCWEERTSQPRIAASCPLLRQR